MLKMQWKQEMLSSPLFYMCNRCVMMNCVAFTDEIPLLFPLSFCQPKVEILRRKMVGFSSLFSLWEKWNYHFNPNITFFMWVFNLKSRVQRVQRWIFDSEKTSKHMITTHSVPLVFQTPTKKSMDFFTFIILLYI